MSHVYRVSFILSGLVCLIALSFAAAVPQAEAASLTTVQTQAFISLLQSFGVDTATINTVRSALGGQSASGSSVSISNGCSGLASDLRIGVSDAAVNGQVSRLQAFLSMTPTGYFGTLTENALKRWQLVHHVVVSAGTGEYGFTGPLTRAAMEKACSTGSTASAAQKSGSSTLSSSLTTSLATVPAAAGSVTTSTSSVPVLPASVPKPVSLFRAAKESPGANLNTLNEEYSIAMINALGKKQGYSDSDLQQVEAAIRQELATTTDLQRKFLNQINAQANASHDSPLMSLLKQVVGKGLSFLGFPAVANASTGAPFGSAEIATAVICTCSDGIWLITMEPLPPTYAAVLAYQSGSQRYSNYTLPFAQAVLGTYTPGVQICYMYAGTSCVPAPNEGFINPLVGSSL